MSTSMVNMSTRLEEDLHNVVIELKAQGQLGSVLRLLLNAIRQDKSATLQFLLGLGNPSISQNKLQDSVVRANLFERYLALGIDTPFPEWVSTLSQADIEVNSGLTFARVDLHEIIQSVVHDLGLELVPKGSRTSGLEDTDALVQLVNQLVDNRLKSHQGEPAPAVEMTVNLSEPESEGAVTEGIPTPSEEVPEVETASESGDGSSTEVAEEPSAETVAVEESSSDDGSDEIDVLDFMSGLMS